MGLRVPIGTQFSTYCVWTISVFRPKYDTRIFSLYFIIFRFFFIFSTSRLWYFWVKHLKLIEGGVSFASGYARGYMDPRAPLKAQIKIGGAAGFRFRGTPEAVALFFIKNQKLTYIKKSVAAFFFDIFRQRFPRKKSRCAQIESESIFFRSTLWRVSRMNKSKLYGLTQALTWPKTYQKFTAKINLNFKTEISDYMCWKQIKNLICRSWEMNFRKLSRTYLRCSTVQRWTLSMIKKNKNWS